MMRTLNRKKVRYLLAGGLAGILHGVPRTTVDVDIMIGPGPKNVSAAVKALEGLGLVPIHFDGGFIRALRRDLTMINAINATTMIAVTTSTATMAPIGSSFWWP